RNTKRDHVLSRKRRPYLSREQFRKTSLAPLLANPLPELPLVRDSKDWLTAEVNRRKKADNIPTGRGAKKAFSEQLENRMAEDHKAGKCHKAVSARRIANMLTELQLVKIIRSRVSQN